MTETRRRALHKELERLLAVSINAHELAESYASQGRWPLARSYQLVCDQALERMEETLRTQRPEHQKVNE